MTRWLGLSLLVAALGWACPAAAHPEVDRARRLVDEGAFEEASRAFDAAMSATDLTREDLVALLEGQALLHHARRDEEALDRALLALASIAPTHRFGPRYPPDLAERSVEMGRRLGGRLRVVADRQPSAVGVRLVPRVEHDPGGLVREIRVRVFDADGGQWRAADPPVEAAAGHRVLAFVEAVGPGGVVIATAGSPDAPLTLEGPGARGGAAGSEGPLETPEPTPAAEEGRGVPDWVWVIVGVGAAALVGLGVGAAVYAAENPYVDYQPSIPMER